MQEEPIWIHTGTTSLTKLTQTVIDLKFFYKESAWEPISCLLWGGPIANIAQVSSVQIGRHRGNLCGPGVNVVYLDVHTWLTDPKKIGFL